MEHEPNSFIPGAELLPQSPRPCSTPHGAPLARLRDDAESPLNATEPGDPDAVSPQFSPERLADVAAYLRRDPEALAEFIGSLAPDGTRGDGWTPFARKLFLQVLADTGRVGLALSYAGLTKQSANALRNRDPLFAAGWDAAALIARNPLADEALEKSLDGITETVTRDGEVVAIRHRYDTRLSIAVLNRLDKRCDRAEETGSKHLAVARRWGEYLDLIGKGDEAGARAILDSPPHGQFGQLPESANPTAVGDLPGTDPSDNVWKNDDGVWMTCFPPPPGFAGHEKGQWDAITWYERECTAEEAELIEAHRTAAKAEYCAEITAEAEAERDAWFAGLRSEMNAWGDPA